MNQTVQNKKIFPAWILYVLIALTIVFLSFYFYSQSLIRMEVPQQQPGEKVIISLPDGGKILTYENYIVEEKGKLFYKGERNTIEFTGGIVIYENWK